MVSQEGALEEGGETKRRVKVVLELTPLPPQTLLHHLQLSHQQLGCIELETEDAYNVKDKSIFTSSSATGMYRIENGRQI